MISVIYAIGLWHGSCLYTQTLDQVVAKLNTQDNQPMINQQWRYPNWPLGFRSQYQPVDSWDYMRYTGEGLCG